MIKAIVSDFSRVLLFPKDESYKGSLNELYKKSLGVQNYNILDNFYLNNELLDFYRSLKDKVNLYMFTSDVIQDAVELKPYLDSIFNKIYSSSKLSLDKKSSESYKKIAKDIGVLSEEIIYIDDSVENIDAATSAGLKAMRYTNNRDLFSEITL